MENEFYFNQILRNKMEFRFKTDSITQENGVKGQKGDIYNIFEKFGGVHRCPSFATKPGWKPSLVAKKHSKFWKKNAPVGWSELGVEELWLFGLKKILILNGPGGDEILDNYTIEW